MIQVDSSILGISATLINDGKIVAFISKRLTDAKSNYANIERELLAVVYACERFHIYVYGWAFQIESDQKQLENVQSKTLQKHSKMTKNVVKAATVWRSNHIQARQRNESSRLCQVYNRIEGQGIELDITIYNVDISILKTIDLQEEDKELKMLKQR